MSERKVIASVPYRGTITEAQRVEIERELNRRYHEWCIAVRMEATSA